MFINGSNAATVNPDGSGETVLAPASAPPHSDVLVLVSGRAPARLHGVGRQRSVRGRRLIRFVPQMEARTQRITNYPDLTPDGQWQDDIPLGYSADGPGSLTDRNGDGDLGHLVVVNANGTGLHQSIRSTFWSVCLLTCGTGRRTGLGSHSRLGSFRPHGKDR